MRNGLHNYSRDQLEHIGRYRAAQLELGTAPEPWLAELDLQRVAHELERRDYALSPKRRSLAARLDDWLGGKA